MVSVNQAKLAGKPDIHNQASHSVVVNAMNDTIVYITNPGSGNPNESIMIDIFIKVFHILISFALMYILYHIQTSKSRRYIIFFVNDL